MFYSPRRSDFQSVDILIGCLYTMENQQISNTHSRKLCLYDNATDLIVSLQLRKESDKFLLKQSLTTPQKFNIQRNIILVEKLRVYMYY